MKRIIVLLFLITFSFTLSQTIYETEQTFNFVDEFNNSQIIIIGKNQWASDGLDPDLGELVIPQVPQGQFGVRFQLPTDTSVMTTRDIRFGCYWEISHEHLIDLRYASGSSTITIHWTWENNEFDALEYIIFENPFNGQVIASYSWSQNPEYFVIPTSLSKIRLVAVYGGSLSYEIFHLLSPNGGEILVGGTEYLINWSVINQLPYPNVEFSSDSGESWEYILYRYPSSHTYYQWTVPMISSNKCIIRVGKYPCTYDISDSVFTITFPVSVGEKEIFPAEFSLSQNYPNPFNPTTIIQYAIGSKQFVSLKVYDVLGNEIATLVNDEKSAGEYEVEFNAKELSSGIYYYQLKAGTFFQTKKMILIR